MLVAYFSHTGETRQMAQTIAKATGADLFEIKTSQFYPQEHEEQLADTRPVLTTRVEHMEDYNGSLSGIPSGGTENPW